MPLTALFHPAYPQESKQDGIGLRWGISDIQDFLLLDISELWSFERSTVLRE
jgi:hypothetical protein